MIGKLSPIEIAEFLAHYDYGRIGCTDGEKLYVVPVSYKFLGDHFLIHSRGGKKVDMLRGHPSVCFEVDQVTDYTHWYCVIAWGHYEEISDAGELATVRGIFADPTLMTKASIPSHEEKEGIHCASVSECKELVFYKIKITEITGRYEYGNGNN